jgi:hypothetical protein
MCRPISLFRCVCVLDRPPRQPRRRARACGACVAAGAGCDAIFGAPKALLQGLETQTGSSETHPLGLSVRCVRGCVGVLLPCVRACSVGVWWCSRPPVTWHSPHASFIPQRCQHSCLASDAAASVVFRRLYSWLGARVFCFVPRDTPHTPALGASHFDPLLAASRSFPHAECGDACVVVESRERGRGGSSFTRQHTRAKAYV